jgi:ATP-dependent Clp protease protease subunit
MKTPEKDFIHFANKHCGIGSLTLSDYSQHVKSMTGSVIEENNKPFREINVFSRLIMDRIIFLGTEVNDEIANIITAQLLFLESTNPEKDILLYINSPGGAVHAGLGIYDTMQYVKSDIATICTGLAASMGAVLLSGGAKGKRSALPHGRIMIHQPLGGMRGQARDMEISYEQIKALAQDLYGILAKHTGKNIKTIEKDSDRDFWMRSEEAKAYGIIDEVHTRKEKYGK